VQKAKGSLRELGNICSVGRRLTAIVMTILGCKLAGLSHLLVLIGHAIVKLHLKDLSVHNGGI